MRLFSLAALVAVFSFLHPTPLSSVEIQLKKPAPVVKVHDGKTPESARKLAQTMTSSRGWNRGAEWRCLRTLWQRESGWRYRADNPNSSAYGIPQLLKLDKDTPPAKQIQRGLRYISHRYGSPCEALAHSDEFGWY